MKIKRFNKSMDNDIFSDEDLLNDILLEYSDEGFKWSKLYKLYKVYNDGSGEWLMPILSLQSRTVSSLDDIFDQDYLKVKYSDAPYPGIIRAYQIEFAEVYEDILATDKQRGDNVRKFQIPPEKIYKFFDITKELQKRFQSMGYTFMLSVHENAEFDLLIADNYK
jgi:hypothetical protein